MCTCTSGPEAWAKGGSSLASWQDRTRDAFMVLRVGADWLVVASNCNKLILACTQDCQQAPQPPPALLPIRYAVGLPKS